MIGIYQDSFLKYLRDFFGNNVKVKSKSIIIPCCWCEYEQKKNHYHLYISLEAPIFHCFGSECHQSGFIKKLMEKLDGKDSSDIYVDKTKIKEKIKSSKIKIEKVTEKKKIHLPVLDTDKFKLKTMYIKQRLRYQNISLNSIKGLIFDVNQFLDMNPEGIAINETLFRMRDYLHSNFVGFLTEHESIVFFRNIDPEAEFKHFKLYIQDSKLIDYYKINGGNYFSNDIILSEGIFDLLSEQIFDSTNLRKSSKIYAAGLSTSYQSLIKSIVFHEQIFRPNIFILSDRDVKLDYYKKIKNLNNHIINSMVVFYNKRGKDFADTPAIPEKIII